MTFLPVRPQGRTGRIFMPAVPEPQIRPRLPRPTRPAERLAPTPYRKAPSRHPEPGVFRRRRFSPPGASRTACIPDRTESTIPFVRTAPACSTDRSPTAAWPLPRHPPEAQTAATVADTRENHYFYARKAADRSARQSRRYAFAGLPNEATRSPIRRFPLSTRPLNAPWKNKLCPAKALSNSSAFWRRSSSYTTISSSTLFFRKRAIPSIAPCGFLSTSASPSSFSSAATSASNPRCEESSA